MVLTVHDDEYTSTYIYTHMYIYNRSLESHHRGDDDDENDDDDDDRMDARHQSNPRRYDDLVRFQESPHSTTVLAVEQYILSYSPSARVIQAVIPRRPAVTTRPVHTTIIIVS